MHRSIYTNGIKLSHFFSIRITKGYDVQFGARPLQRVINTKLQNPLAEALLQGDFAEGDVITVGLDKVADKLVFDRDTALATAS